MKAENYREIYSLIFMYYILKINELNIHFKKWEEDKNRLNSKKVEGNKLKKREIEIHSKIILMMYNTKSWVLND